MLVLMMVTVVGCSKTAKDETKNADVVEQGAETTTGDSDTSVKDQEPVTDTEATKEEPTPVEAGDVVDESSDTATDTP